METKVIVEGDMVAIICTRDEADRIQTLVGQCVPNAGVHNVWEAFCVAIPKVSDTNYCKYRLDGLRAITVDDFVEEAR